MTFCDVLASFLLMLNKEMILPILKFSHLEINKGRKIQNRPFSFSEHIFLREVGSS